ADHADQLLTVRLRHPVARLDLLAVRDAGLERGLARVVFRGAGNGGGVRTGRGGGGYAAFHRGRVPPSCGWGRARSWDSGRWGRERGAGKRDQPGTASPFADAEPVGAGGPTAFFAPRARS